MGRRSHLRTLLLVALACTASARTMSAQTCGGGTLVVNDEADTNDGVCGAQCTLREAIIAANANADCTTIAFDFTTDPNQIGAITLTAPLPTITAPVHILGWTEPGATRIGEAGEPPFFSVGIGGKTHNIAGSALKLVDAPGSLIEGLWIVGFESGAAIEIVATTNADQHITIRENMLGQHWLNVGDTNRVGISVQARGVHIGGFQGTPFNVPPELAGFQLPDPVDWRAGNIIVNTIGPAIHVTTSPNGVQGQARILGNHQLVNVFPKPPSGLQIDLGPEGRTPNDDGDPDVGPNDLQNFPEISWVPLRIRPYDPGDPPCVPGQQADLEMTCDAVRVTVLLRNAPPNTYTAELHAGFFDDPLADPEDASERFRSWGTRTVSGSGDISFIFDLPTAHSQAAIHVIQYLAGATAHPPQIFATVSQGDVTTFAGATSEWSDTGGSTPPATTYTRYFAEGSTGPFFDTTFSLSNFGSAATEATLTFDTDGGQTITHTVQVPAGGRPVTIPVDAIPGLSGAAFGTRITAGAQLVSSRTMAWDQTGYGTHADNGVASPRTRWFLAEGVTGSFDTYVLLYNPSATDAAIAMTFYRVSPLAPIQKTYTVAAHRRLTVLVDTVDPGLAATDVAIDVQSTNGVPIVVERSVYLSSATTVYEAGTCASASDVGTSWYFGEGAALGTFDTFLLMVNPSTTPAPVEVRYLRRFGGPVTETYTVPPQQRLSIYTDLIPALANQEFGMVVTSLNGVPIAAERAMWGGGQVFIDGHASPGVATPSVRWGLNGGEADSAALADTYILIVNPTSSDTTARITLFFEDGTSSPARTVPVPAERRVNVSVAATFPEADGKRFSMLVESIGPGTPALVVERSTYTSPGSLWRAASNETGTPLP